MAGRGRVGDELVAADAAWLVKEVEFLTWLEGVVQTKFSEGTEPRHALLEVQFFLLSAQEQIAGQSLGETPGARK